MGASRRGASALGASAKDGRRAESAEARRARLVKAAKRHLAGRGVQLALVLVASVVVAPAMAMWTPGHVFVVASGSMGHAIPKGSLVVSGSSDPSALAVGDVIVYNSVAGPREVHRVTHVETDPVMHEPRFTTRGDANDAPDSYIVKAGDVVGKVRFHVPLAGYLWLMPASIQTSLFIAFLVTYLAASMWEARAWLGRRWAWTVATTMVMLAAPLGEAAVQGTYAKSNLTYTVIGTNPIPLAAGTFGTATVASGSASASVTQTAPLLWKETALWGCAAGTAFPLSCTYTPTLSSYTLNNVLSSPNNLVLVDASQYDGTVNFYLEAVMQTEATRTLSVRLFDNTAGSAVTGSEITTTSTTATVVRSSAFTLSGSDEYLFQAKVTGGTASAITSVKLLSAQTYPTKTVTHVPISHAGQVTGTTFTVPAGANKWLYEGGSLDGTTTVAFEAVGAASALSTASFRLIDRTAASTTSTITTTSNTVARVRSASLTLTTGHEYEVEIQNSLVAGTTTLYEARMVVVQSSFTKTLRYEDLAWTATTTSSSFTSLAAGGRYNPATEWGAKDAAIFEATLRNSGAGATTAQLFDDTASAAVASSSISMSGTTSSRQRATGLTLSVTSPTAYHLQAKAASGTAEVHGAWLIVAQADGKTYDSALTSRNDVVSGCTWTFSLQETAATGLASVTKATIALRGDGGLQSQILVASGSLTQSTGTAVSVAYGNVADHVITNRLGASGTVSISYDVLGTCDGIHTSEPVTQTLQ